MTIDEKTVTAARLLIDQLGLTPEDLTWTPVAAPTFAEYLPIVRKAAGPGAVRTYGSYWDRIHDAYATRHLDEVVATDIEILMRETMANTVQRRNSRGGTSSPPCEPSTPTPSPTAESTPAATPPPPSPNPGDPPTTAGPCPTPN